jgi:hypothetical protein
MIIGGVDTGYVKSQHFEGGSLLAVTLSALPVPT